MQLSIERIRALAADFDQADVPPISHEQADLLVRLLAGGASPTKYDELRVRRVAIRFGLQLSKSRIRDPRSAEYGRYQLLNTATGKPAFGADRHGRPTKTLYEIDAYLDLKQEV